MDLWTFIKDSWTATSDVRAVVLPILTGIGGSVLTKNTEMNKQNLEIVNKFRSRLFENYRVVSFLRDVPIERSVHFGEYIYVKEEILQLISDLRHTPYSIKIKMREDNLAAIIDRVSDYLSSHTEMIGNRLFIDGHETHHDFQPNEELVTKRDFISDSFSRAFVEIEEIVKLSPEFYPYNWKGVLNFYKHRSY